MLRILVLALLASSVAHAQPRDFDPLDFHDTTVTFEELPTAHATWQRYAKVHYRAILPIALVSGRRLTLWFLEPLDEQGSSRSRGGRMRGFDLAPSIANESFTALSTDEYERDISGPIHGAVRVRATPTAERRQIVVYMPPDSHLVLVATKLVSETTWTPLLHVEVPNAKTIDLIQPHGH